MNIYLFIYYIYVYKLAVNPSMYYVDIPSIFRKALKNLGISVYQVISVLKINKTEIDFIITSIINMAYELLGPSTLIIIERYCFRFCFQ